ncbi:diacylglycerol kinase family protein [Vagococcus sp. PNs007]|uniref:Diacylglycerol kinase family protein n=1 Tax=Vagococcus proximus TaxID=2991417 RepID=A0ABT5X0I8_9ENTE|nr:diacylglycerol kinase family protein [Vagococcus proximus]MDF0479522.1 diacylglycerol kinase family protein [Vagococcus proximus]
MAYQDKDPFQTSKNKSFFRSLQHALRGIRTAFKEERNMRYHVLAGFVILVLALIVQLKLNEWLWLLLVIFLVIAMEILNTLVENTVDLVTDYHYHPLAKKIKDMAAALVLLTAFFALLVGGIIFIPKVLPLLI